MKNFMLFIEGRDGRLFGSDGVTHYFKDRNNDTLKVGVNEIIYRY